MYADDVTEKKPRTSCLVAGVFIAFMIYGMFNAERANALLMVALPYAILIGLVSSLICALMRPFIR